MFLYLAFLSICGEGAGARLSLLSPASLAVGSEGVGARRMLFFLAPFAVDG